MSDMMNNLFCFMGLQIVFLIIVAIGIAVVRSFNQGCGNKKGEK